MDYVEILRGKIKRLRGEIRELNEQYRLQGEKTEHAEHAYRKRHERLRAIQHELAQLGDFGRNVQSVEEMKEKQPSLLHLVKKAS